ncbi:TonB-dependent receptor [Sphingomonas solaris]|uniref:TonB-dependent receptor n=2 Tax=Alterirhizorhabdus solaris TaxID=2529389 RepID=A0A558R7X5_9SPHN|nr:TonB-dependent receptor [Sphingomonas solaris]
MTAGLTLAASPALAQAGSGVPLPVSAKAVQPATVRATTDGGGGVPEIIVTARRRAEDAQAVPGGLSVVGAALIDRSYTVNTSQLSQLVPSLNYSSANPRNTAFTIRGLGSSVVAVSQANDGLEPGVGFYVDQVYHARPATAAFDFTDIEQIEVLRGPQGTLFGKNSTAGAINITSRLPSFMPEMRGEVSFGSDNFLQAKASGSGPITDTLAFRISALSTRRDGVIRNLTVGRDQNTLGNQAVRGQLLYKPSEALQVRLIADFANFQNECCTQVYVRVAPTLKAAARQYPALAANLPGGPYRPPSLNPYDRVTDIDAELGVSTSEGGVSGIVDWDFGGATLTSVTACRFWNWDAANDRDYTGIPIQVTQHIPSRQDQYSQELRVASNGDGPVSYVGGLYFFRQRITGRPISIYGPRGAYWLLFADSNLLDGYGSDGRTDFRSDSYAAFGEANWRPLPGLTLTGGLRYTYEEKEGTYDTFTFGGPAVVTAAQRASQRTILNGQSYAASDRNGDVTGRANISYALTDEVRGYVSYARGAKSGGINMSGLPLDNNGQPALNTAVVKPEKNTAWEVGLKTQLFDRRLTLNIDAFHTTVRDFQANVTDTGAAVALRTYLANIPEVRVKGIEADAIAQVTRDFQLRASGAYSRGRYVSYPNGPCPIERIGTGTSACDLSGRGLSGLPKWSVTLGADYAHPLDGLGRDGAILLHVSSNTRSRTFGDPTASAFTIIGGYTIVNGSIGLRFAEGLEVAVFSRNLFDKNYIQNLTIQAGNSGLVLGTPNDPRTIGATLRARL